VRMQTPRLAHRPLVGSDATIRLPSYTTITGGGQAQSSSAFGGHTTSAEERSSRSARSTHA
jgi:hypothetical protein